MLKCDRFLSEETGIWYASYDDYLYKEHPQWKIQWDAKWDRIMKEENDYLLEIWKYVILKHKINKYRYKLKRKGNKYVKMQCM